jgi:hypothetical protein
MNIQKFGIVSTLNKGEYFSCLVNEVLTAIFEICRWRLGVKEKNQIYRKLRFANISSRYVFSCVIYFRFIHFILISTAHALFLTCSAKWHVFYIRNRHISVSSFVYKYDHWPHDSCMTGRAGVCEAYDIVQFYIALLDFFPATL